MDTPCPSFVLDNLRWTHPTPEPLSTESQEQKPQKKGFFLKGPIPLDWLAVAACLPGRSLHVGVALWLRSGVEKSNRVKLPQKLMREFGVDRHAVYRGLRHLEDAGLVSVDRRSGRLARVTIRFPPRDRGSPTPST